MTFQILNTRISDMTSPEIPSSNNFSSMVELLQVISRQSKELEEAARNRLYAGDPHGYAEVIRERAQLIADIPNSISRYQEQGCKVPEEVILIVTTYASFAEQVINTGSTFGMAKLLEPMGTEIDDPNLFDMLANGLQLPEAEQ